MTLEEMAKLAEQGDIDAQFNLGSCYYYGEGVAQDYGKAIYWYTKAAEHGDADAQYNLGWCYYNGEGVVKNLNKAKELWLKAKAQGDKDSAACLKEYFKIN